MQHGSYEKLVTRHRISNNSFIKKKVMCLIIKFLNFINMKNLANFKHSKNHNSFCVNIKNIY